MKNQLRHFSIAVSLFLLAACGTNRNDVSIQLTYIAVENRSATTSVAHTDPVESYGPEAENDLSGATIRISKDVELYGDKVGTVNFGHGTFVDGSLVARGLVRKPTRLTVSVDAGEPIDLPRIGLKRTIGGEEIEVEPKSLTLSRTEPITSLVVAPGDEIELALIDYISEGTDRFVAVGNASNVLNPWKRFSVSGDLSSVTRDSNMAFVEVKGKEYDKRGKIVDVIYGNVMLKDGKFSLSAEVSDATVVAVDVYVDHCFVAGAKAIVEPNASLSVSAHDRLGLLIATATEGKHSLLVDSWQMRDEYQALQESFSRKLKELQDLTSGESIESKFNGSESVSVLEQQDARATDRFGGKDTVRFLQGGCAQLKLDADKILRLEEVDERYAELYELATRISSARDAVLRKALLDSEDPIDGLLAMELGAFANDSDGKAESIRIYERLIATLDEDTLARRVIPAYEEIKARLSSIEN